MAVFCRPTATTSAAEAAGLLASPNPTTEILTLRQPAQTAASLRLLDACSMPWAAPYFASRPPPLRHSFPLRRWLPAFTPRNSWMPRGAF